MKKILLIFLGMLFSAHMVYAGKWYYVDYKDAAGTYRDAVNDVNMTWQQVKNQYIRESYWDVCSQSYEKGTSANAGTVNNRNILTCDFTKLTDDNPPSTWWKPFRFWERQDTSGDTPPIRCRTYTDDVFKIDTYNKYEAGRYDGTWMGNEKVHFVPTCYWEDKSKRFQQGRIREASRMGQTDRYGHAMKTWWDVTNYCSEGWCNIGAVVHHTLFKERDQEGEAECFYYTEGYGDNFNGRSFDRSRGCAVEFWNSVMTQDAFRRVLDANPPYCRQYNGSEWKKGVKDLNGNKLTESKAIEYSAPKMDVGQDNHWVALDKKNCPTTQSITVGGKTYTRVFQDFWGGNYCKDKHRELSETTYPCEDNEYTRAYTWNWQSSYPRNDGHTTRAGFSNWGDKNRTYEVYSWLLKCKPYYDEWVGGNKYQGHCQGSFNVIETDDADSGATYTGSEPCYSNGSSGCYKKHTGYKIDNIAKMATTAGSSTYYSRYSGRISCTGNGVTHESNPNSGWATCRCNANTYWTTTRCNTKKNAPEVCTDLGNGAGNVCAVERKCNTYYNGSPDSCWAYYQIYQSDDADTQYGKYPDDTGVNKHYGKILATTSDVTNIENQAMGQWNHPYAGQLLWCDASTKKNATHSSPASSATIYCKCNSNTFWTKERCESKIVNSKQYCEKKAPLAGYPELCSWELKSCDNYYNRVNGKCVGKYYHSYKDSKVTTLTDGGYDTEDVTNAVNQEKTRLGNSTRVTCAMKNANNCKHSSTEATCQIDCTCKSGTTFWTYSACQQYRKAQGNQESYYCKYNSSAKDICAYEYTSGKASNSVSSCNGYSSEFSKNSNKNACTVKTYTVK